MQEQVNDKTVALSVKAGKLSARTLAKLMSAALHQIKKARASPTVGDQSVKKLNRKIGGDIDNIEVMGRIKSFERIARKHQISYHLEKDKNSQPPKWTVYFKANQSGRLSAAFAEYSNKVLKNTKTQKPSLLANLKKMQERAKNQITNREKHRNHGGHER